MALSLLSHFRAKPRQKKMHQLYVVVINYLKGTIHAFAHDANPGSVDHSKFLPSGRAHCSKRRSRQPAPIDPAAQIVPLRCGGLVLLQIAQHQADVMVDFLALELMQQPLGSATQ
jgi:hypothetical protein